MWLHRTLKADSGGRAPGLSFHHWKDKLFGVDWPAHFASDIPDPRSSSSANHRWRSCEVNLEQLCLWRQERERLSTLCQSSLASVDNREVDGFLSFDPWSWFLKIIQVESQLSIETLCLFSPSNAIAWVVSSMDLNSKKAKFLSRFIWQARTGLPTACAKPERCICWLKYSIISSSVTPNGIFPTYNLRMDENRGQTWLLLMSSLRLPSGLTRDCRPNDWNCSLRSVSDDVSRDLSSCLHSLVLERCNMFKAWWRNVPISEKDSKWVFAVNWIFSDSLTNLAFFVWKILMMDDGHLLRESVSDIQPLVCL